MRIILFGVPEFGTMCLQTLISTNRKPVAVVLPPRTHPMYALNVANCRDYGVPAIGFDKTLKEKAFIKQIKSYKPDVMIIASYPRLIPSVVYNIPRLGVINCHPTLLPQYRGPNPYYHIIRNGETESGITFHYVDDSFDTGDIILQVKYPLEPDETIGSLFVKTSLQSCALYMQILEKLEQGHVFTRYKQPKDVPGLKYATEVFNRMDLFRIDWTLPGIELDRMVRAGNPFFPAYTYYKGTILRIYSGYHKDIEHSHSPGTIAEITQDSMAIATSTGYFYPTCIHFYSLYICDVKEFIRRNDLKVGELLN